MSTSSQLRLLAEKRFAPFFATQLSGAFNDNLFKNTLVLLMTYHAAQYSTMAPGLLANIAAGLFVLPFLLFSALAGQLADKYDKTLLIRVIKGAEVAIMGVAAVGFYCHNVTWLLTALFLMGTHSSFFGPVKYAMLPQVLSADELVGGNGLLEMGTFLAILGGTIGAGLLAAATTDPFWISFAVGAVAVLGVVFSCLMPRTKAAAPELTIGWNPWRQTMDTLRFARTNRAVFLSLLGISWFWFFGALLLAQFAGYAKQVLGGDEGVVVALLSLFSLGVAAGSLLCEKLSGKRVEIGLVPFGSLGLTIFAVDLYFASPAQPVAGLTVAALFGSAAYLREIVDLVMIGLFGGFYIVPLYALVQSRTAKTHQSRVIAANNILNSLFMIGAAAVAAGLLAMGASIPQLILLCGVLNALVACYIYALVPEFLWRFLDWLLVHSVYRVKRERLEVIPEEGAALLVCNHVSYADALIIAAYVRRPIRFVMDAGIFRVPVLGFLFKAVRAIPIAPAKQDAAVLEQAYADISAALTNGELVCIFPEGGLSADGTMRPFKKGVERILASNPVPVVPLALSGLWGSPESRAHRSITNRLKAVRWGRKVTLSAGALQPAPLSADELQKEVAELRGDRP